MLKVRIFEPYEGSIFPTIQRPGADLGVQRVTDEGTINVPYAGTVKVAGLDLTQIEQRIASQLAGKAQDPQVIVEFVADRTHTVMVSGDVKQPGRISLLEGTRSVVDAINRAGGPYSPKLPAAQLEVVVRRNGQVILTVSILRSAGRRRYRHSEGRRDRRSPQFADLHGARGRPEGGQCRADQGQPRRSWRPWGRSAA